MDRKYLIDTEENRKFLDEAAWGLFEFGRHFPAPDGSAYCLGYDGNPCGEEDRKTFVSARMAHVYSIAEYMGYEGGKGLVEAALGGMLGALKDNVNGGWYEGLTAENAPLPNKWCYTHAFMILGATAGMIVGAEGAEEMLDEALEVYDKYFWNEEEGISCDTWNTDFTVCDDYRGLNANMHSVEAFLAAADVGGREEYRVRAGRVIDRVLRFAADHNWRLPEHYTKEWVPELECNKDRPDDTFKPYGATPGHGLEWARLIIQWALSTYKEDKAGLQPYLDAAANLYDRAITDAWYADGKPGIVYTTDWEGRPVVHDRMHWVLMEAINTASVLYRQTGEQKYADDYAAFMEYMDEKVMDHVNGSFFHRMDRNNEMVGSVQATKSDLYHALQAMLIPYYVSDVSIALAVKNGLKV